MKKFLNLILFICIFCFCGVIRVDAATIKLDKTSAKPGENVTLTVSDAKSNSGYTLGYDNTLLEITSGSCGGSNIETDKVKDGCNVIFKIKQASLTSDKSVSFTLTDKASSEETTPITLVIKANTVVTTPTTTTTQAPKSNNANLKTLEVKANDGSDVVLSPAFNSGVYDYTATVDATIKTININATLEDNKSNMIISNNANEELVAGENNKIVITVTAEDGVTKKAYNINIKREALTADATLKSLEIKECKDFKFKEDKFSYNVKVANSVNSLSIDYVLSSLDATVSISGNKNLKNGSKVKILVTAEDGTKKEYILNIVKSLKVTKKNVNNVVPEKNPLIIMALSMIGFGLIGGIIYVVKK